MPARTRKRLGVRKRPTLIGMSANVRASHRRESSHKDLLV